jgi:hypothetical protein
VVERLARYRNEHEELWAQVERLTAERDQLLRRLSGVAEPAPDYPPPPGARPLANGPASAPFVKDPPSQPTKPSKPARHSYPRRAH